MINIFEVTETNKMVEKENLDVRTITTSQVSSEDPAMEFQPPESPL